MLVRMSINNKWVSSIIERVSSVSYKIIVDGKQINTTIPTRGLSQWDSLSAHLSLFVLGLSTLQLGL